MLNITQIWMALLILIAYASAISFAQQPITLATHDQIAAVDAQAIERIRKIVLHQGDSPRALANLVQLTRNLDAAASAQLFLDLADEYLQLGNYDQAANFLQQLLNQHATQPAAHDGLRRFMQLYTSSEIYHQRHATANQSTTPSTNKVANSRADLCTFALYIADSTLQKNQSLSNDHALVFQHALTAQNANRQLLAKNLRSQLKHNSAAKVWQTLARTEKWLAEGRQNEAPLPVIICYQASERPHLDGLLTDPTWQVAASLQQPVRFSYDDKFLYLAVHYPKSPKTTYSPDSRPRTPDADLTKHDHVRLRLDLDRDYTTCYELAVDYRGWTADACWRDTNWNPQWFVAANNNDTTWVIEAAIPWEQITNSSPSSGQAWAVDIDRMLPSSATPASASATPIEQGFQLLLFQ